jgi:hypothetical protein
MQTRRATLRHAGALAGLLAASGLLVTSAHAAYNMRSAALLIGFLL